MEKLTVITPTYNRAYTLSACYESLCAQIDKRFLWLIVDDGSTDDTEVLVEKWIEEKKINIQYLKKENGGKASALNLAIDQLESDYAVCLDSDDIFYENAVELAIEQLDSIMGRQNCCGILALRNNPDGTVMGGVEIPQTMNFVTAADIFMKLHLNTELICFYKTEILKEYRFPEFSGEKFVSPAWMQYEITQKYVYKTSWEKLCQCEYVADGLTRNKRKVIVKNPKGYTCVKRQSFANSRRLKQIIKNGIMYDCGCILSRDTDWLKNAPKKGWAIVLYPMAWFVYYQRFYKLRKK